MILDTSAIVAILYGENDADAYVSAIASADACRISAATFVEAAIVIEAQMKPGGGRQLDALLRRARVKIEPVTVEHAHIARQAFADFGKGRHRARLHFGDCFAYALAKATGEPLLFKGNDFRRTDVKPALSTG
ncbi:MAG TPA: type II toxin-antitoxin system VapC family toxin [Casimicrobiaceae bacterium]|nr:type II toxin-antitoxin system VapC family toxin [Casimicrobiaceae bacterium]